VRAPRRGASKQQDHDHDGHCRDRRVACESGSRGKRTARVRATVYAAMRRGNVVLLCVVGTIATSAGAPAVETASGHGPCGCLTPASGPAGTTVSASSPAYKVVFNPDRTDLAIGPRLLWRDHRPAFAPTVVFRTTYRYSDLPPTGPVDFQVPAAPPGRYLVSIYDGSEGGSHYTWEYFRVTERRVGPPATRASATSPPATAEAPGPSLLASVIVGVAALLVGLVLGAGGARRCHRFARIQ
jgi:hypothetical protein